MDKKLKWDCEASSKKSYTQGKIKIDNFISRVFIAISKSVLKGEFLHCSNNKLKDLCEISQDDILADDPNKLKHDLQHRFRQFNNELSDIANIYRLHIQTIEDKIQLSECNYIVNAVSRHSPDFSIVQFQALYVIIRVCFQEYELSYSNDYIQLLILQKDELTEIEKKQENKDIKDIIRLVLFKIDFLLRKLSHLSHNHIITYFLNFKQQSIQATNPSDTEYELDSYFQYFLTPSTISQNKVSEWQEACTHKNAKVWHLVLLMRYYTKVTKSKMQIKNLLSHYNVLHTELLQEEMCRFDKYALKTVKNYMYNSQFSFITKDKNSTYQEVVGTLDEIIDLQYETQIHNFHPYKKAVVYFVSHIRCCIQKEEPLASIREKESYLSKTIIPKLDEAFKWCRQNQFYPFQLTQNDCNVPIKELSMILFSPSSFSRPIQYERLSEIIASLRMDVKALESEIQLYEEHRKIIAIKEEFEKSKRTQVEILGVFAALLTFFIGCLTIFTNATKDVSILEKIKHISYLGIILLLFISAGYFFVTEKPRGWKAKIFGGMIIAYTLILVKIFFIQ